MKVYESVIGAWLEHKSVLPAVVQSVLRFALGLRLVTPRHNVDWNERRKLAREEIVAVLQFRELVRQDHHLANDT